MIFSTFPCASWLFIYLLWRNVYWDLLPIFKNGLFIFLLLIVRVFNIFWIQVPSQIYDLQISFPILWVPFHFLLASCSAQKFLIFIGQFFYFSLLLLVLYLRSHAYLKITKMYSFVSAADRSLRSFTYPGFRSLFVPKCRFIRL